MRRDSQTVFIVVLLGLLALTTIMMWSFWRGAGLALVTVILLKPMYQWILRRVRGRRYFAATLALIATTLLILLPLGAILTTITVEAIHFSQMAGEQLGQGALAQSLDELNQWMQRLLAPLGSMISADIDLRVITGNLVREFAQSLYQFSPLVVSKTAHFGFSVVMWMIFLFIFFADGERLYQYILDMSPMAPEYERRISRGVREMVSAVLAGMVATSLANALLMGIAFAVCHIERPFVWALITFGLSFIPIVGAFMVWGGVAVYFLLAGAWPYALGMTLFGLIIIAQTDNLIKPLVMRGRVKVHPLLLLLSILGGVKTMGPVGLIFGPVFIAILVEVLQLYRTEVLPQ